MKVSLPIAATPALPCSMDPHADLYKMPRASSPLSFLSKRAFLIGAAMMALGGATETSALTCVENFDANTDYFPVKLSTKYATTFDIEYHKSYKKITVDSVVTYAYLCGTTPPTEVDATEANTIQIPIDSVALASTTYLPFVNYIGERTSIKYIPASFDQLGSCERKLYDASMLTAGFSFDATATNSLAVSSTGEDLDLVLVGGYDGTSGLPSHTKRIHLAETSESLLGAVEYLKVVAALYNVEQAGSYVVDSIANRYNCVKNMVTSNPPAGPKKKVLWFSYSVTYGYNTIKCPNYYCQAIADAGGELLLPAASNNKFTDAEIIALADEADVIVYVDVNWYESSQYSGPFFNGSMAASLAGTKAITSKSVFDLQGSHLQNWFNERLAQPDVLLMDLLQAMYGTKYISATRKKVFLRNVDTEVAASQAPRDPATCANVDAPLYVDFLSGPCAAAGNGDGEAKPTNAPTSAANAITASWMAVAAVLAVAGYVV